MKNLAIYGLLLSFVGFESCKDKTHQPTARTETITSTNCYQAIYEKDTLDLKLNTLKSGKINGKLVMKVFNDSIKTGYVAGQFRGDTLFVDFSERVYKNPLAFLKKDGTLILGKGQIQTTMGISYLVKDVPIDFEHVKYKFSAVECPSE